MNSYICFVDDVVSANLCCRKAPDEAVGAVFNVARGDRISVNRLATDLMTIMGVDVPPVHDERREGDVRDSQADSTKAATLLRWRPTVGFQEGLERTVEWFMSVSRNRQT